MSWNRIGLGIFVSVGIFILPAATVRADFDLLSGNVPQVDENVLLGGDAMGMQVIGFTHQTNTAVLFESSSQFLADPSAGQARIEARAADDINIAQVAIEDDLTISLLDPTLAYQSLVFNAFIGGGLGAGGDLSVIVSGLDSNDNMISETFGPETLTNGANFFTVVATNGQLITSVTLSPGANASYADLRQVRIGGIIPEPSTFVLSGLLVPLLFWGLRSRQQNG